MDALSPDLQGPPIGAGPTSPVQPLPSLVSYFQAFSPTPRWDDLPTWPPDVFALANLVLDHTEGYRFVIAPPMGKRWPPTRDWNDQVAAAASGWRAVCNGRGLELPPLVQECWDLLTRARDVPLTSVRCGEEWDVCEALLTLHAVADEACAGLASPLRPADGSFEARAQAFLEQRGSLSTLAPDRVRIVPKSHFISRGITIRSLSRYLALCYESVDVCWRRVETEIGRQGPSPGNRAYQVLLIPWPHAVQARDFHAVPTVLDNMDLGTFGFFEFTPQMPVDPAYVESLLAASCEQVGKVDAVVLPEAAVERRDVALLEPALQRQGTTFLVAGVREPPTAAGFGRNYLHFGVQTADGWQRFEQDKHHRWCLDGNQLRQYHLTRSLDPDKQWWEAIDIPPRTLHVIDVGGGTTAAPLVCEDLSRMDEVADLVRRIGPTVVIAVLLDGPQLASRWPFRYASVLADEPGSAVLTLTSFGMASRSRPPGRQPSRVVALWNDSTEGWRELALARGAHAILITVKVVGRTRWTADGRQHRDVPSVTLAGVHQIRRPPEPGRWAREGGVHLPRQRSGTRATSA